MQSGKGRQDYFRTTVGGAVYGVGAEGALTGFGAGRKRPEFGGGIVIDDPIQALDALTVRREKCNQVVLTSPVLAPERRAHAHPAHHAAAA